MRRCLFIVAKAPVVGLAKTRLAASIGAEHTLALYRCFLRDTLALAGSVPHCALAFSFWPPEAAADLRALHATALLCPQQGTDFGSRLLSGFTQLADEGFDEMVLIGSDNPSLPAAYVTQAFDALATAPTVLGASEDGGYYLIGMRAPQPALFHTGIAWSTAAVAQQTLAAAADAGLAMPCVPTWYDIDTIDDLQRLHRDLCAGRGVAPHTLAQLDQFVQEGITTLTRDVVSRLATV